MASLIRSEKKGERERKSALGYECEKGRHDLWPELKEERETGKDRKRKKVH